MVALVGEPQGDAFGRNAGRGQDSAGGVVAAEVESGRAPPRLANLVKRAQPQLVRAELVEKKIA